MSKKYKIIYADPPWSFNNPNSGGTMISGASAKYKVMSIQDMCAMPIQDLADEDCVLFMWWVASQPEEALALVKAWGFKVKTMTGFNWVKETTKGNPYFGMGFWTRAGSECCLIATRGKIKRADASVRSVVTSPVGRHSEKPDEIRKRIVTLMGEDLPKIELFARNASEGWDVFGNEVEESINIYPELD